MYSSERKNTAAQILSDKDISLIVIGYVIETLAALVSPMPCQSLQSVVQKS